MITDGKRSPVGLRMYSLIMVLLMIAMGLSTLVPVVEETDGWEAYNPKPTYTSGSSGYAYQNDYDSEWKKYSGTNFYVGEYYSSYYGRPERTHGWLGFDVSGLADNANINSITVQIRVSSVYTSSGAFSGSPNFRIILELLYSNPYALSAEDAFNVVDDGYYLTAYQCTSPGTISYTFTYTAFDLIKNMVKNGENYIYFGLSCQYRSYSSSYYCYRERAYISGYNSYLRMNVDRSAPTVPITNTLDQYQNSTTVPINQYSYDLPLNGNSSGVEYQVGLFNNETASDPYQTYEWNSHESLKMTQFQDDQTYYFRSRSRDAREFTSAWSECTNTTIDVSPPSIPVLEPHQVYTEGTSVTVDWSDSVDAGIGLSNYSLHRSTDLLFSTYDEMIFSPGNNSYTYDDCVNGETYYFRMMANDTFDQWSDPCPLVTTTMDDEAPSVPVMMIEPIFTKGLTNSFQWHQAIDNGIGLDGYQVQIATAETFEPEEVLGDIKTDQTQVTFSDLDDGVTYHVRVRSIDEFNHTSAWSSLQWSVQDDTGPGEPGLISLMEYQMDGAVQLGWEGSVDDGVGVGWYMVEWSQDVDFVEDVITKDHVLGQSMTILDLETDVPFYFRVTAYDVLGTMGAMETTSTTLDSSPPDQPVIAKMDEYTNGTRQLVTWSVPTDEVSGLDHYLLEVFTDGAAATIRTFDVHTIENEFEVPGLMGGQIYYYRVTAFDVAGNSIVSGMRYSTQDMMGPVVELSIGDLFGSNDPNIEGTVYDDVSGVTNVEISLDGKTTWNECPLTSGEWVYPVSSIPMGVDTAFIRSTDKVGNVGEPIIVNIDMVVPEIEMISPVSGTLISGPLQITGSIRDLHLASYSIYYRLIGTEAWEPITPERPTSYISGVLGTWLPSGLPDGDYFIKVTATDALDQSSMTQFNLTLRQALLSIRPSSIMFSDVDPLLGDTVTVTVPVSNLGSADAQDVTVTIYDDGVEIKTVEGQTVPAMDVLTIEVELPITGYHNITARASSPSYDTGEMTTAAKLVAEVPEPEEEPIEEGFLEDSAGILGLLALFVGLLAILIAIILGFVLSRRKPLEAKEDKDVPPGMPPAPETPALSGAGETSEELPPAEVKESEQLPPTPPEKAELPGLPPPTVPISEPVLEEIVPTPEPAPVEPVSTPEPTPAQPVSTPEPVPAPAQPGFMPSPSAAPVPQAQAPVLDAPTPATPEVQLP